jgi:hypothetical protein
MNWLKRFKQAVKLLIVIGGFASMVMCVIYNPHRDLELLDAQFKGDITDFKKTLSHSEHSWSGQIIELNGSLSNIEKGALVLNKNVFCQFERLPNVLSENKTSPIKIKGRFIGYDALLDEFKLDHCVLLNN